jgi:hypothetical protein
MAKETGKQFLQGQPGACSREEILELLGEPDIARDQDKVWLYGDPRSTALIFAMYGISEIIDYQYLLLEFEKDQLKNVEVIEQHLGCSSTGTCITWDVYEKNSDKTALAKETIVSTKGRKDIEAKRYPTHPGRCSFYMYTPNSGLYALLTGVDIGFLKDVRLDRKTYMNVHLDPGEYRVTARSYAYDYKRDEPIDMSVSCEAGEIIFLKINYSQWNIFNVHITGIEIENSKEAKKTVKNKSLLLLPTASDK